MKNLSANYIISAEGIFFKNGLLVATDDGITIDLIDTNGKVKELAQLAFYNGILIQNFEFLKIRNIKNNRQIVPVLPFGISTETEQLELISIEQFFETCKQFQLKFPELKIPEIIKQLNEKLLNENSFKKKPVPGIYLLKGVDLQNLQFKANFSLKIINL